MTLQELLEHTATKSTADKVLADFTRTKQYIKMSKVYYRRMIEKQIELHREPQRIATYPAGSIEPGDRVKVNGRFREVLTVNRAKRGYVEVIFSTRLRRQWSNLKLLKYRSNDYKIYDYRDINRKRYPNGLSDLRIEGKHCGRCKEYKTKEHFYFNPSISTALSLYCKPCSINYVKMSKSRSKRKDNE